MWFTIKRDMQPHVLFLYLCFYSQTFGQNQTIQYNTIQYNTLYYIKKQQDANEGG